MAYIVGRPEGFSDTAIALVKAIADYGHYMTPFVINNGTGVETDTTIDCYTVYTDGQISDAKTAVASMALTLEDTNAILRGATYSLVLGSETTLLMYFGAAEGKTITGTGQIAVTNENGSTVEKASVTFDGDRYCVRIPNINAAQLADRFIVTVTDSENHIATINASALSYANTIMTSDTYKNDSVSVNAMTSLYYYYLATRNYI